MQFDNSFSVAKPIDEVWATMLDLERVIPACRTREVLEKTRHDAVTAGVKIRLGSMSMNYSGPAEILERDDAAHRAVLHARARRRPAARATPRPTVEITLAEAGDGTEAKLHSDVIVTGRRRRWGRGSSSRSPRR